MRRHTLQSCQNTASNRGGACLSAEYKRTDIKMLWRCAAGHEWSAGYDSILAGCWCKKCASKAMVTRTIDDCRTLGIERGGKCLSDEYVQAQAKLLWSCAAEHVWEATFDSVRRGSWCQVCSGKAKHTIDDCVQAAKANGGRCLSAAYIDANTLMQWECNEGHVWKATYSGINNSGTWCKVCSGLGKHTIQECQSLAESSGGKCLSTEYVNSRAHLNWECSLGHRWPASYSNIKHGKWCPDCRLKTQVLLKDLCERVLDAKAVSGFRGFEWLRTDAGRKQEIDIWFPTLKLAIEYDGQQHFKPVKCWGGEEGLTNVQRLDRIKTNKILEHKEDVLAFIRFSYKDELSEALVKQRLGELGVA
jgi:hypothetical protein